jgi:hypothetical protein
MKKNWLTCCWEVWIFFKNSQPTTWCSSLLTSQSMNTMSANFPCHVSKLSHAMSANFLMPCQQIFLCHVTNFLKTWRNGISTRNNDDRKYPLLQIIVAIIIIIIIIIVMILSCNTSPLRQRLLAHLVHHARSVFSFSTYPRSSSWLPYPKVSFVIK